MLGADDPALTKQEEAILEQRGAAVPKVVLVDWHRPATRLATELAHEAHAQAAAPRQERAVTHLPNVDVTFKDRRHGACRDGVSTGGYLDGLGARPCAHGVNTPEKRA